MRRSSRWVAALLLVAAGSTTAWAAHHASEPTSPDAIEATMTQYHLHPAIHKLGRGLSNSLGGWLEVPLNIHQRYTERDTGGSLFTGLIYGLIRTVVRTGVGLYETATFFYPYPKDFRPILPAVAYFQKSPKRAPLLFE